MMTLAINTITAAADAAGITSLAEFSEEIDDVLDDDEYPLPRLEYSVLDDEIDLSGTGLLTAVRNTEMEYRKRRKYRRTLRLRAAIAAETESAAEDFFKDFLKNLPRHIPDGDGMDVRVAPNRVERKGFSRKLVEVFPKKEIVVFITFTGGIYTDEEVGLIKEVNINPEVQ
jgi:tRNA A37 threonylcarbamoyltransferase TsaD